MWVLFACSAAVGVGGLMLMVPFKGGASLVTWQARVSIIINSVIAFFIVAMMVVLGRRPAFETLILRLGSVAVDLALWIFLSSRAVGEFFVQQSQAGGRGFEVVIRERR